MLRKSLLFLLITTSLARGVTTSSWQTVTMADAGTGLYTNGQIIGYSEGIFKPSFGCYTVLANPILTAASVYVTNGTITSGTVTNTRAIDSDYLIVNESGPWQIDFTFTNGVGVPHVINFTGYYQGNPSHAANVSVLASNKVTGSYSNILSGWINPDGATISYKFNLPKPETNYIDSAGRVRVRFNHGSSGVGSHNFGVDYVGILKAEISLPTAGVYYAVSPVAECGAVNLTSSTNTATFTTIDSGWYDVFIGGSGTGTSNTTYEARAFTNGAASDIFFKRTIGTEGSLGNASDNGIIYLPAGATVTPKLSCDRTNSWASFVNFHFKMWKMGN